MAQDSGDRLIRLKNGEEISSSILTPLLMTLETLAMEHPRAFNDLVLVCRNQNYIPSGTSLDLLERAELILLQRGRIRVYDSIRSIALSAAEGSGLNIRFVSPVAD
jgi:hypothetical protein